MVTDDRAELPFLVHQTTSGAAKKRRMIRKDAFTVNFDQIEIERSV
jgi:hypothetical protein